MYIYPDNLKAKATMWLWSLKDLAIVGIIILFSVFAFAYAGVWFPLVIAGAYLVLALMDVVASCNYLEIFKWLFQEIYINSMIYVSMDCANELYIYVGSAETQEERERVQFLLDTFLPIGMRTEVFYLEHFGILDMEETMVIDKVLLI